VANISRQKITEIGQDIHSGCRYNRRDAIGEIGEFGLTQFIPQVIDKAKNDNYGIVREKAIVVLGRIGKESTEAKAALEHIVQHHFHPDEKFLAEKALAQLTT